MIGVALVSRSDQFGTRDAPTVMYLANMPRVRRNSSIESDGKCMPAGGHFWDGRADTLEEQAKQPLFNPVGMNNTDIPALIAKVAKRAYAGDLRNARGDFFDERDVTHNAVAASIAAFERTSVFLPFTSKFDHVMRAEVQVTEQKQRGLSLCTIRQNGNRAQRRTVDTASCDPRKSLFTDFSYRALGLPRSQHIPKNDDPPLIDLALCERAAGGGAQITGDHDSAASDRPSNLRPPQNTDAAQYHHQRSVHAQQPVRPSVRRGSFLCDARYRSGTGGSRGASTSTTCRRSITPISTSTRRRISVLTVSAHNSPTRESTILWCFCTRLLTATERSQAEAEAGRRSTLCRREVQRHLPPAARGEYGSRQMFRVRASGRNSSFCYAVMYRVACRLRLPPPRQRFATLNYTTSNKDCAIAPRITPAACGSRRPRGRRRRSWHGAPPSVGTLAT